MKNQLGDRIKCFYEDRFRYTLPRRTYTIIRIDGKAFHTYTNGLNYPFDNGFIDDMNETTKYLCKKIQGVKFGYVQSDEISLLLTDFENLQTDMWFDGNLQKICSVAASMATAKFNQLRILRYLSEKLNNDIINITPLFIENLSKVKQAEFDARVFQISNPIEVENYFIWRQQDATRNSISSVAYSLYSNDEVNGKSSNEKQEMIFQKGINWNDYGSREKRGGFIYKIPTETPNIYLMKQSGGDTSTSPTIIRNIWSTIECPIFTQEREFLRTKIPTYYNGENT